MRQIELAQRLADGHKPILRSIFAAIANPRRHKGHFGVFLYILVGAPGLNAQGLPEHVRREGGPAKLGVHVR